MSPLPRTRPAWKPLFEQSALQRLGIAAVLCALLWTVVAWALT